MAENTLVKQLIEENLRIQNPYLDLGNCGLDGTEPELEMLAKCTHLKTLVFSNKWDEYDAEKQKWVEHQSQNQGQRNKLTQIPPYLAKNITKLVLAGEWYYRFEIQDISFLQGLQNLHTLDLSNNQIQDIYLDDFEELTNIYLKGNPLLE